MPRTFADCMDVFDWFDSPMYDYLYHIWISKCDAETRIARALPFIIEEAVQLIVSHRKSDEAYPEDLLDQPA